MRTSDVLPIITGWLPVLPNVDIFAALYPSVHTPIQLMS